VNGDISSHKSECSGESITRFGGEPSVADIFGSFTGLTSPQTKALAERAHIYMTADGRISMAGLNGKNIDHFAESVSSAVKGTL
jgi:hypothetical protein